MSEYRLQYSRELVRQSVLAHLRQRVEIQDRILFCAVIAGLLIAWYFQAANWLVYTLAGLALLVTVVPFVAYQLYVRDGYRKIDAMDGGIARLVIGPESIVFEASGLTSEMIWEKVVGLSIYERFCHIHLDGRNFITLPSDDLGEEGINKLREKLAHVLRTDA